MLAQLKGTGLEPGPLIDSVQTLRGGSRDAVTFQAKTVQAHKGLRPESPLALFTNSNGHNAGTWTVSRCARVNRRRVYGFA